MVEALGTHEMFLSEQDDDEETREWEETQIRRFGGPDLKGPKTAVSSTSES